MLGDLAVLTGGQAIFKDLGIALDAVKLSDLGKAKKVIITSDNTTVVSGAGTKQAIDGRRCPDSCGNRKHDQRL
jgi:chaperonin GroEL